jgi:hypothetical protein
VMKCVDTCVTSTVETRIVAGGGTTRPMY